MPKAIFSIFIVGLLLCSSANADDIMDALAQRSGFRDWNHYQTSHSDCLKLLSTNTERLLRTKCATGDLNCLMRQAQERMSITRTITSSREWRAKSCHRITWGTSSPSYDDLADEVERLNKRVEELERR